VHSLERAATDRNRQHTFFFLGPSGCGKTTLARIACNLFDVPPQSVVEVDGASQRGIDDMKTVVQNLRYAGFGEYPNKAIVVDECHQLSKDAWNSLLKITEEPPEHVFFFFCSTDPSKIPGAIATRGPQYVLKPVRFDDLMDLLEFVVDEEKLDTPNAHLEIVARACGGSPRQALVQLAMIQGARDEDECEALLQGAGQQKEVIDLCRRMVGGSLTWPDVQKNLKPLTDLGAEGIRIQVTLYLSAVLMGNVKAKETGRLLDMLDAFSRPCNQTDKLAPILLAFGRFVDI
jgi:DNA polymerase-3 subunit gamma/tau